MECKVVLQSRRSIPLKNWNISRMECKASCNPPDPQSALIGIYPEWNVKFFTNSCTVFSVLIGIYPEWNVKINLHLSILMRKLLEYIQNGM